MRRATFQLFHIARRAPVRKLLTSTAIVSRFPVPFRAATFRSISHGSRKDGPSHILSASMQLSKYSAVALLVALGGGVWYYRDGRFSDVGGTVKSSTTPANPQNSLTPYSEKFLLASSQPRKLLNPANGAETKQVGETLGRSLIVDGEQFFVDISENIPLTKSVKDPSQQVLEMLTPDQVTQKLRRNEESYLVGRGQGVVRYDVVQIPSNNPIEDDHAEKIVEVPQSVTPPRDGASSSDWMFWGVFDGHR